MSVLSWVGLATRHPMSQIIRPFRALLIQLCPRRPYHTSSQFRSSPSHLSKWKVEIYGLIWVQRWRLSSMNAIRAQLVLGRKELPIMVWSQGEIGTNQD
jgi:hypothetical protein